MLSLSAWVISVLTLWYAAQLDARSSTLALLANGYSPDEIAAAGVTASELQAAITRLNTEGIPLRLETATATHESAARSLASAREEYLARRSNESRLTLESAVQAERAAHHTVESVRVEIDEHFTESVSSGADSRLRRCLATSQHRLPIPYRFVDPAVALPEAIAKAERRMARDARDGRAADPADIQLIQRAENDSDVRQAETNLTARGDAIWAIYDTNLQR